MSHPISLWPRSGGDRGNRSRAAFPGPSRGVVLRRTPLASSLPPEQSTSSHSSGGALDAHGNLRVTFRASLFSLTPDGQLLWARDLRQWLLPDDDMPDENTPDENTDERTDEEYDPYVPRIYHSMPSIIGQDTTLVGACSTAMLIDADGNLFDRISVPAFDDSGYAPNYDFSNTPILTTIGCGVFRWATTEVQEQHLLGYDVVPVALFPDNSYAISGYAGDGFCRVRSDGSIQWQTKLRDADMLPTINRHGISAVGSANDQCSVLFSPEGEEIARYGHPATFAEYIDAGWIAHSRGALARLGERGRLIWQQALPDSGYPYQPIVDSEGYIYVVNGQELLAFGMRGQQRYALDLGGEPGPLLPVRAGMFACVVGDELVFIG